MIAYNLSTPLSKINGIGLLKNRGYKQTIEQYSQNSDG